MCLLSGGSLPWFIAKNEVGCVTVHLALQDPSWHILKLSTKICQKLSETVRICQNLSESDSDWQQLNIEEANRSSTRLQASNLNEIRPKPDSPFSVEGAQLEIVVSHLHPS